MKYQLIDVGRGKYNGSVDVPDEFQLLREVKKHLVSNAVDIQWLDEEETKAVITAGFHSVGHVQRVSG